MTTNTTKTRKQAVKASDLAILAMMEGVSALDSKLAGHTNPVAVLDKVIATFKAYGKDTADLVSKRDLFANAKGNGVKGRKAPILGETRGYRAQQIVKDGEPGDVFIRLPLGSLNGCAKGSIVNVTFAADRLIVALASVAAPVEGAPEASAESDSDDSEADADDLGSDEGEALAE